MKGVGGEGVFVEVALLMVEGGEGGRKGCCRHAQMIILW